MEEGGNLARTIPTPNPDPDQEQGGLGVWCGVNRQRAERSRALDGSNKSENQKIFWFSKVLEPIGLGLGLGSGSVWGAGFWVGYIVRVGFWILDFPTDRILSRIREQPGPPLNSRAELAEENPPALSKFESYKAANSKDIARIRTQKKRKRTHEPSILQTKPIKSHSGLGLLWCIKIEN